MEGNPSFAIVVPGKQAIDRYPHPLSVNEAFRYTPLTTSPLHASDNIPVPTLSARHPQSRLVSDAERKAISRLHLDHEVQKKLHTLLDPSHLAEIKFKQHPEPAVQTARISKFSPLANSVLEGIQIDYRYPAQARHASKANASAYQANGAIQSKQPTFATPPGSSQLSVEITQPQSFRREDYAVVPDSPKRRKLNNEAKEAEVALKLRTQKEQGDEAVSHLQDLLTDLFHAHGRIEVNSGNIPTDIQCFEAPDADEDFALRLTSSTLEILQQNLKQLVLLKRLSDVPVPDLEKLQDLCAPAIQKSSSLPLNLDRSASEGEQNSWLLRLRKAENGASAALTLLYTYLGSSAEELHAKPDALQAIPDLLNNSVDYVLVPVIESRPDGQGDWLFALVSEYSELLKKLLDTCKKLLDALTSTCVQVQAARDCVSQTEFIASNLIFAQNGSSDKTAALGSQNYERVRKQAMSSLARVFAAFPEERAVILDNILSSLDKLPSTSRSARQFKLPDNKSIMLVSALFIQLVQTASFESSRNRTKRKSGLNETDSVDPTTDDDDPMNGATAEDADNDSSNGDAKIQLRARADALYQPAGNNAKEIALYLISKASKVTKTGDSPYRNILDLFVEDMISLLPLPEWPAAELLLRLLANRMIDLARHEKAAGIKNMALESLGAMGSAISVSRASARTLASNLSRDTDIGDSETASILIKITDDHFASGLRHEEVVSPDGPLALTCRYYQTRGSPSLRAKSARSFHLAQYAFFVSHVWETVTDQSGDSTLRSVAIEVLEQIAEAASDSDNSADQSAIGPREANLAYLLCVLNLGFCLKYEVIVRTLLSSLSSEQAQVRSRSLKSVVAILETDPSLLDRDPSIADDVFKCAADDSAMVRDAALSLIAKFIIARPALEEKGIKRLLECAGDVKVGVQKRAIGHLGDIYAQDHRPNLKAAIAQTFLRRTADFEETVSELAKKTLADVWITPHLSLMREPADSAKSKVAMESLCAHIVDTLDHDPSELSRLLVLYVKGLLKATKSSSSLISLLDRLAEVVFQSIISGTAASTSLLTLMSFAEARPESVAPNQLAHLRKYLNSVSADDLPMFKSVIAIFRHVLPRLSVSHHIMLKDIQDDLMKSINKLARRMDLDEVMSCLRTIDGVLHNGARVARLLVSVLNQICSSGVNDNMKTMLIRIGGSMGKHLDIDALTVTGLKEYRGGSLSGFLTDAIYRHGILSQSGSLEMVSLESLGAICQSCPSQFNKQDIDTLFCSALDPTDKANNLLDKTKGQLIVLKIFDELFATVAASKDDVDKEKDAAGETQDLKKMGGSAKTQDDNSAIASVANAIKRPLVKIALSEHGETAALSVRTLASIAGGGMFHPKDYAGVFIALETSEDPELRKVAIQSHQLAHQHHETHFEREYMQAIQQAFAYQRSLSNEPTGIWQGKAKLGPCFEIVNTSGSKYVKKFLSNLVTRLSTDYAKLDISKAIPDHVHFVRFIAQNIAYFEYSRLDDLLHVILQLEMLFSKNGAEIAQAVELNIRLEATPFPAAFGIDDAASDNAQAVPQVVPTNAASVPDTGLLRRLAAAACAVTIISETKSHLKRQYGVSRDVKAFMQQQKQAKESTKAPTKVYGISGDKFVAASTSVLFSMGSEQAMISRCREFYELMSVDEDLRITDDGDDQRDSYSAGPEMEAVYAGPRGRKRKNQPGSGGGTPKKPRGRPRKSGLNGTRRSASGSSREDPDGEYWE